MRHIPEKMTAIAVNNQVKNIEKVTESTPSVALKTSIYAP
jgi:hypothetical protein|tara:strand:+ start:5463 stop:5582 length:120 start_codon:yes stop_codon:yes gene_type:complete